MNPRIRYFRKYVGPLQAVIFDWAGTTVDKYAITPAVTFKKLFEQHNVSITMDEIRVPMGIRKDLHIKALLNMTTVRQKWYNIHERYPQMDDAVRLYEDLIPLQINTLKENSKLIPGTASTVQALQKKFNLKIGTSTGFNEEMVSILAESAKNQGYIPDSYVAGDSVLNGSRPLPHMIYKNMDNLNINPVSAVVKVDDTTSGIEEGLEAGCWTIGVSRYSNYMNINSLEEEKNLSSVELEDRNRYAKEILNKSGAHYVVDNIKHIPNLISIINTRLKNGETP